MMFSWFKAKHSVCKECGVHFEPVTGFDARWGDLCHEHRKPVKDRDLRKDNVMAWAGANWERLEEQRQKDLDKQMEEQVEAYNRGIGSLGQNSSNYGQVRTAQQADTSIRRMFSGW